MPNDDYFAGAPHPSQVMISDTVNQMLASQRRRRPRTAVGDVRRLYWALELGNVGVRTIWWFLNPWC